MSKDLLEHRIEAKRRRAMRAAIRHATSDDLPRLLELYRLLDVGAEPELGLAKARRVFDALASVQGHDIYVAESEEGVVGTFALIFIDGLAHGARCFGLVEDVVVATDARGQGIGKAMMRFAMQRCAERRCYKLALSSHLRREEAHRFYEGLGFAQHGYSFLVA
jgi:GNAT superfamily N-acetyltransferase